MNTAKDVALCVVAAMYLFAALALDLRLLVLPSVLALGWATGAALAQRRVRPRLGSW